MLSVTMCFWFRSLIRFSLCLSVSVSLSPSLNLFSPWPFCFLVDPMFYPQEFKGHKNPWVASHFLVCPKFQSWQIFLQKKKLRILEWPLAVLFCFVFHFCVYCPYNLYNFVCSQMSSIDDYHFLVRFSAYFQWKHWFQLSSLPLVKEILCYLQ